MHPTSAQVVDEPDPQDTLDRLLQILSPAQFARFVEHCEDVNAHGWGEAWIVWENGRPKLIYHRASDNV